MNAEKLHDDQELIRRAKQGDANALDSLLNRHQGSIYRVVRARLSDEHLREDCIQETLLGICQRLRDFDPAGTASFRTWVCSIAEHKAIDTSRKLTQDHAHRDATAFIEEVIKKHSSPSAKMRREDVIRILQKVTAQLPSGQQQVVQLCVYQNMTGDEAAASLGVSRAVVYVRLSRALARLRDLLGSPSGAGA